MKSVVGIKYKYNTEQKQFYMYHFLRKFVDVSRHLRRTARNRDLDLLRHSFTIVVLERVIIKRKIFEADFFST